jgi:MOSC domain-containing protein YiiM
MNKVRYLTMGELEANLDLIRRAPRDSGRLELIVCRPGIDEREVLTEGILDMQVGLVGDTWGQRIKSRASDGSPDPDVQLTLMNARVISLLAQARERWPLAGDQLFVDLDLSAANLPPGTRLKIGTAVIEITGKPHNGCAKFGARFGNDALQFVNSAVHKDLHLRGVNAKIIQPGLLKTGDSLIIIQEPEA